MININKNVSLWVEINANRYRITNKSKMEEVFKKCQKSGIGTILLSVKDTSGFGIYKSKFVPHYSLKNELFEDFDYLKYYIELAKKYGLRIIPAIDVFAEGSIKAPNPLSPAVKNPSLQTTLYCIDENNKPHFKRVAEDKSGLYSMGLIENYFAMFVNPILKEVRDYELSIIREIAENYDIEGICLDRVRYIGFGADFSLESKMAFEDFINTKINNFPEDIMTLKYLGDKKVEMIRGKYYSDWQCFRAHYLKVFIEDVKKVLVENKVELWDYTGNWYNQYDDVAANWASSKNLDIPYPGVESEKYAKEGYAELLDCLLTGTYYKVSTIEDGEKIGYSKESTIEGGIELAKKVTKNVVPVYGSLGLWEFKNEKELAEKCFDASIKYSGGCMIFDMCYLDDFDYYDVISVNKKKEN